MAKIKVSCVNCNDLIERYPSQCLGTIYCSKSCMIEYLKKNNSVTFNCEVCDKEVTTSKSNYSKSKHHYCSYDCSRKGYSINYNGSSSPNFLNTFTNCSYCNKEIYKKKSDFKRSKNLFCSNSCKDMWQSENIRGENHPNYNPNVSEYDRINRRNYTEYWDFRKNVYKRDDYACKCCGDNRGHNLVAHHILNYHDHKDLRTDIDNGITLCDNCHNEFHKKYGNKANNLEQLLEFLTYIKGTL